MSTYGEKHIQHNANANTIIRVSEWRVFNFNIKDLLTEINDYVTDDWEDFQQHNVYFGLDEEFSTCDPEMLLEWIDEIIEQRLEDDMEEEEVEWLRKWIEPLKQAEGFTLHVEYMPEWAKKEEQP